MTFTQRSFAMVGPTRVGKTSLLAAMYDQLNDNCAAIGCKLIADADSQGLLNDRRNELENSTQYGATNSVGPGIQGDSEEQRYKFRLEIPVRGEEPESMVLQFIDMPGGWYTNSAASNMDAASANISGSSASIWVIDAVAMMQKIANRHTQANQPKSIYDAYQRAFSKRNDEWEHTIVLTLIRAETYVRADSEKDAAKIEKKKEQGFRDLAEQVKKLYGEYIVKLKNTNPGLKLNIVITYAETTGTLFFQAYKASEENGRKVEKVEFKCPSKEYKPRGCSRPILLVLKAVLADEHQSAKGKEDDLRQLHQNVADRKRELESAVKDAESAFLRAAKKYKELDTMYGNFVEYFWQKESNLGKARIEKSRSDADLTNAEAHVKHAENELQKAQEKLAQAGNIVTSLHDKIKELTTLLNKNEYEYYKL